MQEKIFELFVQVGLPAEPRDALGVGLSFVKHMMSLHDGSVQVRSEGPGKGSEFSIRLPLKDF